MEAKINTLTNEVEFITYTGGDAYSAPAVLKSNGIIKEYLYLHRDYQSSIVAISNSSGVIIEKCHFDAWGQVVRVQDAQGNILAGLSVLDRGYTGHEHLQSVGLIHMNGRLYDAKLHRFLQPDNFIQEPYNTQNYNRYGYVLNNPLKYTDPSGEEAILAAIIVGAIIGATSYTLTALLTDVPFSVGGFLKSTFMGALSGAVTFGIGNAAQGIKELGARFVFQAFAHGSSQVVLAGIQGGDMLAAFASGALSSMASGLWAGGAQAGEWKGLGGTWAKGDFGTLAFGTVSGGAGGRLTGGNFWQGAATGLTVSLLNHVAHKMQHRDQVMDHLDAAGLEPWDESSAQLDNNGLKTFGEKVYPKMSAEAGNLIYEKGVIDNDPNIEGQAVKLEPIRNADRTFTIKSGGKIKIGLNAVVSNYKLASTIGHELIHAIDHVSGLYSGWYNKFKAAGANALSEIKAHNFQQGSPYNYNPARHNHFINLASQNGWKF